MKQRTRSSFKKRVKRSGSGKLRMAGAARRHLLSSKSTKTRRAKSNGMDVPKGHVKLISSFI